MNISTSSRYSQRRKPNNTTNIEEDATTLKFGPEFDLKQIGNDGNEAMLMTLNLSEARLLIKETLRHRNVNKRNVEIDENNNEDDEMYYSRDNDVLRKTQEYLAMFARFRTDSTVDSVEHLLKGSATSSLHPFEIAQLGNLACDDSEEAKTLVPSLNGKISDSELQVLLDQLRRFD
ncbi:hypothetical protein CANCADRAFT_13541, partial [Tortispora caseinolytica NRRL Y-17796]